MSNSNELTDAEARALVEAGVEASGGREALEREVQRSSPVLGDVAAELNAAPAAPPGLHGDTKRRLHGVRALYDFAFPLLSRGVAKCIQRARGLAPVDAVYAVNWALAMVMEDGYRFLLDSGAPPELIAQLRGEVASTVTATYAQHAADQKQKAESKIILLSERGH